MQYRVRVAPEPRSLARFILLSLLVHLTVIVLFRQPLGVPGGVGERGLLRTLEIVLQRPQRDAAPERPSEPSVWQRWIGTPERTPRETRSRELLPREPTPPVEGQAPEAATQTAPARAEEALPRIDPEATTEADKPLARPTETAPQPLPDRPLAPFEIAPPREIERELPVAPPPLAPAPPLPVQPLPKIVAPPPRAIERELPPPPELPAAQPLPAQPLPRIDAPSSRAFDRELPAAPELPAPAPLPSRALPRVDTPAARTIERELPAAPELPAAAPLPSQALPRIETPAARAIERELPPAPELAAPAPLPSQALPRIDTPAAPAIGPMPSLAAPPRGVPDAEPAPRLFLPAPPVIEAKPAKPDAEQPAGTPGFDFERAREVARDFNRRGGRVAGNPVDFDPPPGERVNALGRAIQKAAQPDCRTAYAALGLLAVVPLIADTVTDRGCRW